MNITSVLSSAGTLVNSTSGFSYFIHLIIPLAILYFIFYKPIKNLSML